MEAICFVTDAWPSRRQACTAHAMAAAEAAGLPVADMQAAAAAPQHSSRRDTAAAAPAASNPTALLSGHSQQQQQHVPDFQLSTTAAAAAVEASGPAATLAWLASFSMEGRVLQQLLGLRPRVVAATGSGIFSGELKLFVLLVTHVCCSRSSSSSSTATSIRGAYVA